MVNPVMFPPGRARLSTKPVATGLVARLSITMGIVVVACLAARTPTYPTPHHDEVHIETDEVSRERWEEGDVAFRVAVLQDDVLSLHVPQLPQALLPFQRSLELSISRGENINGERRTRKL